MVAGLLFIMKTILVLRTGFSKQNLLATTADWSKVEVKIPHRSFPTHKKQSFFNNLLCAQCLKTKMVAF